MSHREVSRQAGKDRFIEHLGDETQILVHRYVLAVAYRDACTFLTPVLKGKEPEVSQPCGLDVWAGNTEHPAGFAWSIHGHRDLKGVRIHGSQCTGTVVP